ncbi:MAG: phospholipase D-like domain-containing protein [Thermodesulfobacteriota bacterium]
MPTHDIIDNRNEKLIDHLNEMLCSCERARFAVGYLFLSGLTGLAKRLLNLNELRLLIGNTSNRETVEMLAEGYRRLDLAAEEVERQMYPKRTEAGRMAQETAGNLRNAVELMDQTNEAEELIAGLIRMIEDKRLKVRLYTKGRFHAKAYICDYGKVFDPAGKEVARHEKGIAVVGSSNLTLAGLTHNTELNVIVLGNQNHEELVRWFDDLWKEAQDFDETLMLELRSSWAAAQVRPYAIYESRGSGPVQLELWGRAEDEFLDLNEAEEILRQLRKEDPLEFDRIANLRDGIRTARSSLQKGLFVFCQAGRFQQLFLLDDKGSVVSRDIPRVVGTVKCSPEAQAVKIPEGHNKEVMAVRRTFAEEVKHREAERKHSFNLTHGQLYVLRELRILFEASTEEEIKGNVNVLEKAFRSALTGAVKRELNQLRRNALTGESLYRNLIRIYDQHNLKDVTARRSLEMEEKAVPRIICSEAFV